MDGYQAGHRAFIKDESISIAAGVGPVVGNDSQVLMGVSGDGYQAGHRAFAQDNQIFRPLPLSAKSMAVALKYVREFLVMINTYKQAGENGFPEPVPKEGFNLDQYAMKIMTAEPACLAAELSGYEIRYPCLYVIAGSAFTCNVVSNNEQ